jgi:hypothetical protein
MKNESQKEIINKIIHAVASNCPPDHCKVLFCYVMTENELDPTDVYDEIKVAIKELPVRRRTYYKGRLGTAEMVEAEEDHAERVRHYRACIREMADIRPQDAAGCLATMEKQVEDNLYVESSNGRSVRIFPVVHIHDPEHPHQEGEEPKKVDTSYRVELELVRNYLKLYLKNTLTNY